MIKMNFTMNASDFNLSLRAGFIHSSQFIKLTYISYESKLTADDEISVSNIFKDSEFLSLHISESDGFEGKFSNMLPNKLYIETKKNNLLHYISMSTELDKEYYKNLLPYLALVCSKNLSANLSISLSTNNSKKIMNEFQNSSENTIFAIDNFEFKFFQCAFE